MELNTSDTFNQHYYDRLRFNCKRLEEAASLIINDEILSILKLDKHSAEHAIDRVYEIVEQSITSEKEEYIQKLVHSLSVLDSTLTSKNEEILTLKEQISQTTEQKQLYSQHNLRLHEVVTQLIAKISIADKTINVDTILSDLKSAVSSPEEFEVGENLSIATLRGELEGVREVVRARNTELSRLQETIKSIQFDRHQNDILKEECSNLEKKLQEKNIANELQEISLKEAEHKIKQAKVEREKLVSKYNELTNTIEYLLNQEECARKAEERFGQMKEAYTKMKKTKDQLKAEVKRLFAELEAEKHSHTATKTSLAECQHSLSEAMLTEQMRSSQLVSQRMATRELAQSLRGELQHCETAVRAELDQYLSDARSSLQALEHRHLSFMAQHSNCIALSQHKEILLEKVREVETLGYVETQKLLENYAKDSAENVTKLREEYFLEQKRVVCELEEELRELRESHRTLEEANVAAAETVREEQLKNKTLSERLENELLGTDSQRKTINELTISLQEAEQAAKSAASRCEVLVSERSAVFDSFRRVLHTHGHGAALPADDLISPKTFHQELELFVQSQNQKMANSDDNFQKQSLQFQQEILNLEREKAQLSQQVQSVEASLKESVEERRTLSSELYSLKQHFFRRKYELSRVVRGQVYPMLTALRTLLRSAKALLAPFCRDCASLLSGNVQAFAQGLTVFRQAEAALEDRVGRAVECTVKLKETETTLQEVLEEKKSLELHQHVTEKTQDEWKAKHTEEYDLLQQQLTTLRGTHAQLLRLLSTALHIDEEHVQESAEEFRFASLAGLVETAVAKMYADGQASVKGEVSHLQREVDDLKHTAELTARKHDNKVTILTENCDKEKQRCKELEAKMEKKNDEFSVLRKTFLRILDMFYQYGPANVRTLMASLQALFEYQRPEYPLKMGAREEHVLAELQAGLKASADHAAAQTAKLSDYVAETHALTTELAQAREAVQREKMLADETAESLTLEMSKLKEAHASELAQAVERARENGLEENAEKLEVLRDQLMDLEQLHYEESERSKSEVRYYKEKLENLQTGQSEMKEEKMLLLSQADAKYDEMKLKANNLKTKLLRMETECDTLKSKIEHLEKEKEEISRQLADAREASLQLKIVRPQLQTALKRCEEFEKLLSTTRQNHKGELQRLEASIKKREEQVRGIEKKNLKYATELKELHERLAVREKKLRERDQRKSEFSAKVSARNSELARLHSLLDQSLSSLSVDQVRVAGDIERERSLLAEQFSASPSPSPSPATPIPFSLSPQK